MKWVANEKNILLLSTSSIKKIVLNPLVFKKLSHFSEMHNDALMHREGLKGWDNLFHVICTMS